MIRCSAYERRPFRPCLALLDGSQLAGDVKLEEIHGIIGSVDCCSGHIDC